MWNSMKIAFILLRFCLMTVLDGEKEQWLHLNSEDI
jgi:hypothetical protein